MADDVTLNSGSGGDTIAADDISGVKYPRSKIVIGADGTNDGDVSSANPLPVTGTVTANAGTGTFAISASALPLPSGAATAAKQPALGTAGTASSDVITIQGVASMTPVTVDLGANNDVTLATLPDTSAGDLAAINSAVSGTLTVGSPGTFAVQVDGDALTALQLIDDAVYTSGTGAPSKGLLALGSDGTNPRAITLDSSGHVQIDVLSSALPSGAATEAKQDTIIGHVDGVESALGDAVTALQIIDDWDESNRAKVNPIVGQAGLTGGAGAVAANTQRITLASDDPGVTLLTTIDTDTGNIASSASSIDGKITACNTGAVVVSSSALPSGAATAANQSTGNSSLADIKAAVEILDNIVSGSEAQVDIVAPLPAGTNAIGKLAANSGVDIGDVDVASISAGSNLIGDVGLSGARTSGGTTIFRSIDLDESEEEVKASAGQVYWIHAINLASSVRYLKFYNATAASVVVGTTTPVLTFPLPTQGDSNGAGFTFAIPNGVAFSTAITVAATTGIADNDIGAPGANEVVLNMGYA